MIVVDASVVANALSDDQRPGEIARLVLDQEPDLHAPHFLDLEVVSTLRRLTAAGQLGVERATQALEDLPLLPMRRYPHGPLLPRIWELRSNVTPYDASYVALAETIGCAFVTTDVRLSRVRTVRCPIEVLS